jgi:hypothetical protein
LLINKTDSRYATVSQLLLAGIWYSLHNYHTPTKS